MPHTPQRHRATPLESGFAAAALLAAAASLSACGGGQRPTAAEHGTPAKSTAESKTAASVVRPAGAAATAATKKTAWTAVVNGKDEVAPSLNMGDERVVEAILDEGKNRNQVMEHLKHLTGEIGPRLTGSTRIEQAGEWIKSRYAGWGLANPHSERWGEIAARFDRGPSTGKVLLRTRKDDVGGEAETVREMQLTTLAWTAGTKGPVRGPVVRLPKSGEEYIRVKDQLKGAWILLEAPPALGQRGVRSRVSAMFEARIAARKEVAEGKKEVSELPIPIRVIFDGIAGFISTSRDERVWTGGAPGWRERKAEDVPPDVQVSVRLSDYDFINSRLTDGDPIEVEFNLDNKFIAGPIPVYNIVAEIPGTTWPEQVVIVSAHLDSWDGPGSQGTTDNGTGTVATIEAARILAAVGARPKRTIRFVHWSGEEQGLLGSKGYVKARQDDGTLDNISAVFVDDGGTNSDGGLPCVEQMKELLAAATAPVNNQFTDSVSGKPLNVNIRVQDRMPKGGASDHASFNAVGIPGFYWDEVGRADYGYGWHTQNDKFDLGIPEYLMQSATASAVTAYRLACADQLLPREAPEKEGSKETESQTPKAALQGASAANPAGSGKPDAPTGPPK